MWGQLVGTLAGGLLNKRGRDSANDDAERRWKMLLEEYRRVAPQQEGLYRSAINETRRGTRRALEANDRSMASASEAGAGAYQFLDRALTSARGATTQRLASRGLGYSSVAGNAQRATAAQVGAGAADIASRLARIRSIVLGDRGRIQQGGAARVAGLQTGLADQKGRSLAQFGGILESRQAVHDPSFAAGLGTLGASFDDWLDEYYKGKTNTSGASSGGP